MYYISMIFLAQIKRGNCLKVPEPLKMWSIIYFILICLPRIVAIEIFTE